MADQKTEKATARRLQKARQEGNFVSARTFVSAGQFLIFVYLVHKFGAEWILDARQGLEEIFRNALDPRLTVTDVVHQAMEVAKRLLMPIGLMGAVMMLITLAGQLLVSGFGVSGKKLTPDIKRLNPLNKLKELPRQNIPAVLQAVIMIPVFGFAVYGAVSQHFTEFLSMPVTDLMSGISKTGDAVDSLLWKAGGLFFVFGIVDLVRQKARYQKDLRMSKQEIRDEMKETEGNPVIKSRIRRIRRDMARKQMMKEIPTATAVIVNPTHYAVALKYSLETPGAPRVVAKGRNYLALRIKQRAIDHSVPIIENKPLAQGLYKSVEVGQEIPAEFYKAVAEVLAYIYRVMDGRSKGKN